MPPALRALRDRLPRGGELPNDEWERRHRALNGILWVLAVVLGAVTAVKGYGSAHLGLHVAPLIACAIAASSDRFPKLLRSLACSAGR
jgi:hypothetical protein